MTRYDPRKHHRRSIRLPGHDYGSPGTYFVTICVQGRECLLGDVEDGQVLHSDLGRVVCTYWQRIPRHFTHVELGRWVVMPNHLRGIVTIVERSEPSPLQGPPSGSLGAIVGNFKSVTTRRINRMRRTPGVRFWQRNYWEHIVRNEASLNRIRAYIVDNPARWMEDQLHPEAPPNRFNQWQP